MQKTVERYGWRAEDIKSGYNLYNRKGAHLVTVTTKGRRYLFAHPNGYKLLSGGGSITAAAEELLTKYFFASVI